MYASCKVFPLIFMDQESMYSQKNIIDFVHNRDYCCILYVLAPVCINFTVHMFAFMIIITIITYIIIFLQLLFLQSLILSTLALSLLSQLFRLYIYTYIYTINNNIDGNNNDLGKNNCINNDDDDDDNNFIDNSNNNINNINNFNLNNKNDNNCDNHNNIVSLSQITTAKPVRPPSRLLLQHNNRDPSDKQREARVERSGNTRES